MFSRALTRGVTSSIRRCQAACGLSGTFRAFQNHKGNITSSQPICSSFFSLTHTSGARAGRPFSSSSQEETGGTGRGAGGSKQEKGEHKNGDGGENGGWWYTRWLDESPVISRAITSMILVTTGDAVAQTWVEKKALADIDTKRLATMGFLGLALIGPVVSQWYVILHRLIPMPGFGGAIARMALDQGVFAGCFLMTFLTCLFTLEKPLNEVIPSLQAQYNSGEYWKSLVVNWELWIPAQLLNFWIIPLRWQMLYVNCVALLWNTYLSYAAHKVLEIDVDSSMEDGKK